MGQRILIVEDQMLIALAIEDAIMALGHQVCGVAASRKEVEQISQPVDIALVDVNLVDGPTGPEIGRQLASQGCSVIFMTANPDAVAHGISGTLGVISKPVRDEDLADLIEFATSSRDGNAVSPPHSLKLFANLCAVLT